MTISELSKEQLAHAETKKKLGILRQAVWNAMQILHQTGSIYQALQQLEAAYNATKE